MSSTYPVVREGAVVEARHQIGVGRAQLLEVDVAESLRLRHASTPSRETKEERTLSATASNPRQT